MKSATKVALSVGVGAGYVLGRTRKMKLALMLAAGGAGGRLPGSPGDLLRQATGALGSSADLGKLGETVRGDLGGAFRAAAVTAAANRIEALNQRLAAPAERDEEEHGDEERGEDEHEHEHEHEEPKRRGATRSKRAAKETEEPEEHEEPEDEYDEEETEDDEYDSEPEDEEEERGEEEPRRRRPSSTDAPRRSRRTESTGGGRERRTRQPARSGAHAPVRRTGR